MRLVPQAVYTISSSLQHRVAFQARIFFRQTILNLIAVRKSQGTYQPCSRQWLRATGVDLSNEGQHAGG
jgi:hypothetical protein